MNAQLMFEKAYVYALYEASTNMGYQGPMFTLSEIIKHETIKGLLRQMWGKFGPATGWCDCSWVTGQWLVEICEPEELEEEEEKKSEGIPFR